SKKSFLPSSTFAGVIGLSAGMAISPSGPTSGFAAGVAGATDGCDAGFSELLAHEATNTSNASTTIFTDFMDASPSKRRAHRPDGFGTPLRGLLTTGRSPHAISVGPTGRPHAVHVGPVVPRFFVRA